MFCIKLLGNVLTLKVCDFKKKLETHLFQGLNPVGSRIINLHELLLPFPQAFSVFVPLFSHLSVLCLVDIYLRSLKFPYHCVIEKNSLMLFLIIITTMNKEAG